MKKKVVSALLVAGVLLSNVSVLADITPDTINEKWGKPTLVYGESVNDQQAELINESLKVQRDKVYIQIASGDDMQTYLGIDTHPQMYSSVLVQKTEKGSGVNVEIVTPENITSVTPTQYANAAITAGASDVSIKVSAPFQVTGESALTGVYKALSGNGVKVDTERTLVAQNEIEVVKGITDTNAAKKDYDSTLLDNALAEIKSNLAKYKKDKGETASKEVITTIVNEALKANGLDGVVTPEQVSQLVDFASKYQDTSAIDSKEVLNQLGQLQDSIKDNVSGLLQAANESGVWEKVSNFFSDLWSSITNLF